MKNLITLAATALLALGAACGNAATGDDADDAAIAAPASLPSERIRTPSECTNPAREARTNPELMGVAVHTCPDVLTWTSAMRMFPRSVGANDASELGVEHLAEACEGRDSASACQDAIEQGLVEPTGDDRMPGALLGPAVECGLAESVADAGVSLTLETSGKKSFGEHSWSDVECMLDALETPQYVREHINTTRGLDGQQEDSWGDTRARWTYHASHGLNITFIAQP